MATLTPLNPERIGSNVGAVQATRDVIIEHDQTYTAGLFLKVVAGYATISTTSAASGVGADAVQLYALTTLAAATGDHATVKTYGVVHEDDVWSINVTGAATAARTDIGQKKQLVVTSTTLNEATDGATHAVFMCNGPVWAKRVFSDNSADTYARILVQVLAAAIYTEAA